MWRSVILICFDVGPVLLEGVDWGCVVLVQFMCLEGFNAEVCAVGGFRCGDYRSCYVSMRGLSLWMSLIVDVWFWLD